MQGEQSMLDRTPTSAYGRKGPRWVWLIAGLLLGAVVTEGVHSLFDTGVRDSAWREGIVVHGPAETSNTNSTSAPALAQAPQSSRSNRIPYQAPHERAAAEDTSAELEHLRRHQEAERLHRLATSFGEPDDVLADPELNPEGKRLSASSKQALREMLSSWNERRSMAQDYLDTLYHEEGVRRMERGEGFQQNGSLPADPSGGGRRVFMTQFSDDGPVNRVIDVYPGESPNIDEASAELELIILEGREELRMLIAQS